jgi:hypothetical protein
VKCPAPLLPSSHSSLTRDAFWPRTASSFTEPSHHPERRRCLQPLVAGVWSPLVAGVHLLGSSSASLVERAAHSRIRCPGAPSTPPIKPRPCFPPRSAARDRSPPPPPLLRQQVHSFRLRVVSNTSPSSLVSCTYRSSGTRTLARPTPPSFDVGHHGHRSCRPFGLDVFASTPAMF